MRLFLTVFVVLFINDQVADVEVYQLKIIRLIGIEFLVRGIQKKSIQVKLKKDSISLSKRNGVMERIQPRSAYKLMLE